MGKFEDMIKETYGTLREQDAEEKPKDGELGTNEEKRLRAKADTDDEAAALVKQLDRDAEDIKSDATKSLNDK